MHADANKNSYVWKKNTERYKKGVQVRVGEMFREIERINKEEDLKYGNKDLEEMGEDSQISSEGIKEHVKKINKIIEDSPLEKSNQKKVERLINKIEKKELPKMQKYETQEKILEERNSYSKTDKDATFFRMKNQQLLPAYTVLAGTEKQYMLNYSLHQRASESDQLKEHIEKYHRYHKKYPKLISGDSAFGSEENCEYLEGKEIENYLKYNTFHYESTKAYKENKFHKDHFKYEEKTDSYQCPNGKKMIFQEEVESQTSTGYKQTIRKYQCESCSRCPYAGDCKKGKGRRTIHINRKLDNYRSKMRENLTSEKGIELRRQRNVDVEPVFGDIKWNHGYARFRLRGKEKVNVEIGLLGIAHNLKKMSLTIN